ncbi:hypothetical protein BpHYR1_052883 [Brachionus plicatilis]|uniref:RNA-directed DNA polymerase from mobile element jockey-like n=1 Tax=Brachionus plicatilis TaxID=10195 RepID=A0A3M7QA46_BRAPC|nr:hypothetical protein BpHYR1_052883 [Brachionus plicatilis]
MYKAKKLQVIQNSATRSILKLKYDTPSERLFNCTLKDLKLHRVDNRLFDLGENYIRRSLQKQVPLTCRLVNEFKLNFESRDITYPTPLWGYYLIIDQLHPLIQTPVLSNF